MTYKKFVNTVSLIICLLLQGEQGTGLLGQSLSNSVTIDFTKHMNQIIQIEDEHVVVEPGTVKGVLDRELRRGKFLPPDPASGNYCTIGGMIANNSSGPHGLGYGSTIDFLEVVSVVYVEGSYGFLSQKNSCEERTTHLVKLLSPYLNVIHDGFHRSKRIRAATD